MLFSKLKKTLAMISIIISCCFILIDLLEKGGTEAFSIANFGLLLYLLKKKMGVICVYYTGRIKLENLYTPTTLSNNQIGNHFALTTNIIGRRKQADDYTKMALT